MSELSDKIAAVNASLDAAVARITADIAALQAKIDAGTVTADELTALDALKARVDGIDVPTPPAQ
jgi:phage host-nuclease inhibitor protein Gam